MTRDEERRSIDAINDQVRALKLADGEKRVLLIEGFEITVQRRGGCTSIRNIRLKKPEPTEPKSSIPG